MAAAYPGTPSTEILEEIAKYDEIYAEWSPNEKVALEVAIGASIAGVRSIVAMKHVGLNVAADPLFTVAYTGVTGGLVIVSADDPGMHSSQNEQDNRNYAKHAKIPMLEPSDSQEAKDFVGLALSISEEYDTPVLLRITTRIAHSKSLVTLGTREPTQAIPYTRRISKYVATPANSRILRVGLEHRLRRLTELSNTIEVNKIEFPEGESEAEIGVVAAGVAYQYAREAFGNNAIYLKLGMTYPMPLELVRQVAERVKTLYVVEELDPLCRIRYRVQVSIALGSKCFEHWRVHSRSSVSSCLNQCCRFCLGIRHGLFFCSRGGRTRCCCVTCNSEASEPLCRVSSPKRVLRSPQAQEHHGDRRHWLLHPGFSCAAFCNGYMYLYGCEHQCRPRRIQGFFVDRQGHSCSSCYWRLDLLSLRNHRALGRRVQPRVLRYYRSRQQDHRHDGTPG